MTKETSRGVSRRRLFSLGGGAIAAGGVVALAAPVAEAEAAAPTNDTRFATATEGTNICATVSPDGKMVAFDIYAMLWVMPIAGGAPKRLTDDIFEICQPDWSPDGKTIAFQSYRDGNFHIWTIGADGAGLKQLTQGAFDCREPRFSPDGQKIAFSSDRGGRYGVHILHLANGSITAFSSGPGDEFEPSWAPDGKSIAFTVDKTRIDVEGFDGARRTVGKVKASADRFNAASVASPAFTPDGKDVIYTAIEGGVAELRSASGPIARGEDVFPFRVSWLPTGDFLYTADGKIKRRSLSAGQAQAIAFTVTVPVIRPRYTKKSRDFLSAKTRPVVGIGSPALSPDGRQIVFRALNDLYLLPVAGGPATPLTKDGFSKVDPAWSPDGKILAYSTDKGGSLDIWLRDMAGGEARQLTHFDGAAVSSAWSRDGKSIAFLSQNGGLFVADAATGETRRVYGDLWEPGKPSWGPGDKTIAYAAFKPYSARFREGLSEILTVDVETGKGTYAPILPDRSLGTRGDDGPAWSPNGASMAFVFASRMHVAPVDATGQLTGPPKPLNNEVTDAVSWSGDGKSLLYISAGQLRLIPAGGGTPRTVPHGLTWANVRPKGRMVVQAGKLWDGKSPELRSEVDVVIEDGRITGVVPRGVVADGQVIDARGLTVMPGLIDMHTHRQMQGYGYGDREGRLWLSLGVTTTRSPGGPAYHTVEDQEAIESGARVGPRYYATGEAIDGSRIFYNFMRPVTEPGQMALEMRRAEALSYDLIKTYVRLSGERQKEVVAWAHSKGLPLTSHYHYPALGLGMDGMEHLGATSRTGYSRTVSALGYTYQDVNAAFVTSKAARTPTLFTSTALLADDRSLVDDDRIRALYPPWEYARLQERAKQMAGMDRTAILASLERNVAEVARTVRAGGRITSGTDSPIDFNAVSLHMNLRAMVKYGMTPFEALVTATSASAEYLDEPLGVIAPGAYADLVLVDGDPLARIEDAAKVAKVIKHGEVYSVADLIGPFAGHVRQAALGGEPGGGRRFVCEAQAEYWWHEPDFLAQARASCCDGACGFTPSFSLQV